MCSASAKGIIISGQKADEMRMDDNLLQPRLYGPKALKTLVKAAVALKAISPGVFKFRKNGWAVSVFL